MLMVPTGLASQRKFAASSRSWAYVLLTENCPQYLRLNLGVHSSRLSSNNSATVCEFPSARSEKDEIGKPSPHLPKFKRRACNWGALLDCTAPVPRG